MTRRDFIQATAAGAIAGMTQTGRSADRNEKSDGGGPRTRPGPAPKKVDAAKIPRWRGFNLQEMFGWGRKPTWFREQDFEIIADWGFDFVRLPMSYWNWADRNDWLNIDERPLKFVDQAIELGKQYGIHVNLNFHRIPGYCVTRPEDDPAQLFQGPPEERKRALAAAVHHWEHFAKRYKGIPSERLSFDLMNEPPFCLADEHLTALLKAQLPDFGKYIIAQGEYEEIVRALVTAIRRIDPDRLIFADGLNIGMTPVEGIVDLRLVQSTRGYAPPTLSHYKASWSAQGAPWLTNRSVPTWPTVVKQSDFKYPLIGLVIGFGRWDKDRLAKDLFSPWREIQSKGVGVHVGEWGCYNRTPHEVALAWMRDNLSIWKAAGWGWALWEFRGGFGVLDSERKDVKYESFKGHKLDRTMLELLRKS